jgi:hypothetical protein
MVISVMFNGEMVVKAYKGRWLSRGEGGEEGGKVGRWEGGQ